MALGEAIDSPGLCFPGLAFAWCIGIGARSSGLLWMEDALQMTIEPGVR